MQDQQTKEILSYFEKKKSNHLVYSLIIDFIGMSGMVIPFLGEAVDIFWAPISAICIFIMYKKTALKARAGIGSFIGFSEELLPFTDVVPTATLMWAYTYHLDRDKTINRIAKRRYKDIEIVNSITSKTYQPSLWFRIKSVFNPKLLNMPDENKKDSTLKYLSEDNKLNEKDY